MGGWVGGALSSPNCLKGWAGAGQRVPADGGGSPCLLAPPRRKDLHLVAAHLAAASSPPASSLCCCRCLAEGREALEGMLAAGTTPKFTFRPYDWTTNSKT